MHHLTRSWKSEVRSLHQLGVRRLWEKSRKIRLEWKTSTKVLVFKWPRSNIMYFCCGSASISKWFADLFFYCGHYWRCFCERFLDWIPISWQRDGWCLVSHGFLVLDFSRGTKINLSIQAHPENDTEKSRGFSKGSNERWKDQRVHVSEGEFTFFS